jgi:hypothetical protein
VAPTPTTSLRGQHSELTRELILRALMELLQESDAEEISIPDVPVGRACRCERSTATSRAGTSCSSPAPTGSSTAAMRMRSRKGPSARSLGPEQHKAAAVLGYLQSATTWVTLHDVGNGKRITFRLLHVWEFKDGLVGRENVWLDGGSIVQQLTDPERAEALA